MKRKTNEFEKFDATMCDLLRRAGIGRQEKVENSWDKTGGESVIYR